MRSSAVDGREQALAPGLFKQLQLALAFLLGAVGLVAGRGIGLAAQGTECMPYL